MCFKVKNRFSKGALGCNINEDRNGQSMDRCPQRSVYTFVGTKMKILLSVTLILSIASVASEDVEIECPTCIKVNTTCYNLTYLKDLTAPFRNRVVVPKMVIMKSKNLLFYSFEPDISDEEYYKVAFTSLNNSDISGTIPFDRKQIYNFGTFDIDQDNNVIYLGGGNGIFSFNFDTNAITPYSSYGDTILDLFYKGYVYFVRYGENKIIQKKGENFETYLPNSIAKVKIFVINKYYVTVYVSNLGMFLHRNGQEVQISKNAFFRGLTIDLEGNVYAWWIDGIYQVIIEKKLQKSKVVKVAHIASIGAMTFDEHNNIIFNTEEALYKLESTPSNVVC